MCSGTRAAELAVRLKYAGSTRPIHVEGDLKRALSRAAATRRRHDAALRAADYTAMLALRELLVKRGEASSAWR